MQPAALAPTFLALVAPVHGPRVARQMAVTARGVAVPLRARAFASAFTGRLAIRLSRESHQQGRSGLTGPRAYPTADLAVEQPTEFELALNLTTTKAQGLTILQSALLRADELIGKDPLGSLPPAPRRCQRLPPISLGSLAIQCLRPAL